MNYLTKWFDAIQSDPSMLLDRSISVTGLRDKHLGPRWEYANVDVLFEPAALFEVRFGPDISHDDSDRAFLDAAIFGVLDILLVYGPDPLRNVRITLTRCEIDPVRSSQMAFRQAGRDAGRKVMAALQIG
jgi:hypothetical protein